MYGVTTGALNRAVARNSSRFPDDFAFVLTTAELESLRFQFGISNARGGRAQDFDDGVSWDRRYHVGAARAAPAFDICHVTRYTHDQVVRGPAHSITVHHRTGEALPTGCRQAGGA